MIPDWIRQAVYEMFGAAPSHRQMAQAAKDLREAADELGRRAEALEGMARRERKNPHGRAPGDYVVIDRQVRHRLEIRIGKAVYRAVGTPPRLDVQRSGQRILLRPALGDVGYKVSGGVGMAPKIRCATAEDLVDIEDGRYAVILHGDVIEISHRLEQQYE